MRSNTCRRTSATASGDLVSRKKPWVEMASHVSKCVATRIVAGSMPMTLVPVKVRLGRHGSGRLMSIVHRVDTSQSPVRAMACMVYVGSKTRRSIAMLNRYPSMSSYLVSGSSNRTVGSYSERSMPRSSNRCVRSSASVAMYASAAAPSSFEAAVGEGSAEAAARGARARRRAPRRKGRGGERASARTGASDEAEDMGAGAAARRGDE